MASDVLSHLEPEFTAKVTQLLANCAEKGVLMVPFYGLRTPFEQAKLWRQSKTKRQINEMVQVLKSRKANFIVHCIESVGPQPMNGWLTNSPPGLSWHQWGYALDCYLKGSSGHPDWNSASPGYSIYANEARALGLTSGYFWPHSDAVHVQYKSRAVLTDYTWEEVNEEMRKRFENIDNSA